MADLTDEQIRALCEAAQAAKADADALPAGAWLDGNESQCAIIAAHWNADDALKEAARTGWPATLAQLDEARAEIERLTAERDQHAADSERRYRLVFAAPSVDEARALAVISQGLAAGARAGVRGDYAAALDALKTHAGQRTAALAEAKAEIARLRSLLP